MPSRLTNRLRIPRITDEMVEQIIGNLLRIGVLLAAAVVLIGGIIYLNQHGADHPEYHIFHGVPPALCHIHGILQWASNLRGRGIIQLGLLLLIATPVARVFLSLLAFTLQRDRIYMAMTLLVLLILLYSLFGDAHV